MSYLFNLTLIAATLATTSCSGSTRFGGKSTVRYSAGPATRRADVQEPLPALPNPEQQNDESEKAAEPALPPSVIENLGAGNVAVSNLIGVASATPQPSLTPEVALTTSPEPTPPPDGGVKLSIDDVGRGHILVTLPIPLLADANVYRIYLAEGASAFDFASPRLEVPIPGPKLIPVGGLKYGTKYCVIVRSANASSHDGSNFKSCITTAALSMSFPLTKALSKTDIDEIMKFHNFRRDNIEVGEVATVAGKYDDVGYRSYEYAIRQAVQLGKPRGVAVDASGNILLVDHSLQIIRKIDAFGNAGIFGGLIGIPEPGSVDGRDIKVTGLYKPYAVAFGPDGHLFVSDGGNHRIRKIDKTTGVVSTVVGAGDQPTLWEESGAATAVHLNFPLGIAFDSQWNMYIADYGHHAIRKVRYENGAYTQVTTIAGNNIGVSGPDGVATAQSIAWPGAVAVDAADVVYFSEYQGNKVRKIDSQGNMVTIVGTGEPRNAGAADFNDVGDGGVATAAKLFLPIGLAIDKPRKHLYVADYGHRRVRKVDLSMPAPVISTVVGNGNVPGGDNEIASTAANLQGPTDLLYHDGSLFISDMLRGKVYKHDFASGQLVSLVGIGSIRGSAGDGGQATSAQFNHVHGIDIDKRNNEMVVVDHANHVVRKINSDGVITRIAGNYGEAAQGGTPDGAALTSALRYPVFVNLGADGTPYFSDYFTHRIRKITADGQLVTVAGVASTDGGGARYNGEDKPATQSNIYYAGRTIFDAIGNMFISDSCNARIRKVNLAGIMSTLAGVGITNCVQQPASGDGGDAKLAQLSTSAIAMDSAGVLYFSDTNSRRIRKITRDAQSGKDIVTAFAGTGADGFSGDGGPASQATFGSIVAMKFDNKGNLYLVDQKYHAVRVIRPNGIIEHVAGIYGSGGFSGDGQKATQARFNAPQDISIDNNGNLYVVDRGNERIRVIRMAW